MQSGTTAIRATININEKFSAKKSGEFLSVGNDKKGGKVCSYPY